MAAAAVIGAATAAPIVAVMVAGITAVAAWRVGHGADRLRGGLCGSIGGGSRAREGEAGDTNECDDGHGDGKDGFHVEGWFGF